MDYEAEKLRSYALARAMADAALMPSRGAVDASYAYPHKASHCDSPEDSHASAWPEPYDPVPDSDSETDAILHANRDLLQVAHLNQLHEPGHRPVDAVGDARDGRPGVSPRDRQPVRPDVEKSMTSREAADALVREAQERGEYDDVMKGLIDAVAEPLSRVPDLIDEIRRERDRLAEKLSCGHRKVDWDDSYGGCVACSAIDAMHKIDAVEKERDELRARVKELDLNLGNILAVIHGDGGHYYVRHGAEKATRDAIDRYYKMRGLR